MKLYVVALLITILSYFGITKNLQLSFFNFFSPIIVSLKEISITISEYSLLLVNLEEVRKENIMLRRVIAGLEDSKNKKILLDRDLKEQNLLEKLFSESELLKKKNISIERIVYYDPFRSLLILENSTGKEVSKNSNVVFGPNLVGIVVSSTNSSIEVSLISKKDFIINTQIINSQNFKIKTVLDSESGDSLVINNILTTEEVKEGDLVITSNSNEFILPDLVVGKVQRIEGISSQTFRKAYLEKNYDLNLKSYVGVVLNDK